jgi:hypothetical protein
MCGGRCGGGEEVEDGEINPDVHTGKIAECVGVEIAECVGVDLHATRRRSAHPKTYGITTWSFLRFFECGASWTAVPLYLLPKAELSGWA